MNRFVLLSLVGYWISWPMSTIAQEVIQYGVPPINLPVEGSAAQAQSYGSSTDLLTQPVTIQRSPLAPTSSGAYPTRNLDAIAGSVRANPSAEEPPALIPASLRPPKPETTVRPLEYFQVPGLSGGVKLQIAQ